LHRFKQQRFKLACPEVLPDGLAGNRKATNDKTVQIYDFNTKKVSCIPASELAPGMILAEVAGGAASGLRLQRLWLRANIVILPSPKTFGAFSDKSKRPWTKSIR